MPARRASSNMKLSWLAFGLLGVALSLYPAASACGEAAVKAPELSDALPASTWVYIHTEGPAANMAALGKTSLGQALAVPEVKEFGSALWADREQFFKALLQLSPKHSESLERDCKTFKEGVELASLFSGRMSFALTGLDADSRPIWYILADIAGRKDRASLIKELNNAGSGKLVEQTGEGAGWLLKADENLFAVTYGQCLLLSGKAGNLPDVAAALGLLPDRKIIMPDSLSVSGAFLQSVAKAGGGNALGYAYMNLNALRENKRGEFVSLLDHFGLGKADCLAVAGAPAGRGIRQSLWISLPENDSSLQTLGLGGNVMDMAKLAAAGDTHLSALRIDAALCWDRFMAMLGEGSNPVRDELLAEIKTAEQACGFALRVELLQSLAPSATLLSARGGEMPRLFPPDIVLRLEIRDAALFDKCLSALRESLGNWRWRTVMDDGAEVNYLVRLGQPWPIAPAYLKRGNDFFIAGYPHVLRQYLKREKLPRLDSAPNFAEAVFGLQLPDGKACAFVYLATGEKTAPAYEGAVAMLHALSSIPGAKADAAILPPARGLGVDWGDTAIALHTEKSGVMLTAYGPFGALSPLVWGLGGSMENPLTMICGPLLPFAAQGFASGFKRGYGMGLSGLGE